MKHGRRTALLACALAIALSTQAHAANKETIDTVDAYIGQNSVRVDVFGHNEIGLLEYFNLIVLDDSMLEFVSIEADRGVLWYGAYPTHVDGDHIYVHGVASPPSYCMDPDWGEPGSPLFHITFNVKQSATAGLAELNFGSEGAFDGHWNNCAGGQISPYPDYYDGGVNILGHAGHVTVGSDSTGPGHQAAVDVYMHNDLDVFEYFNQILFEDAIADVDSIAALRGVLHYGNYPTHVSGDTIYVHGWAGSGECFNADHSYPGAGLYRIYFTIDESAPTDYTMPLTFLEGDFVWNHWVGCDLGTTDSFTSTDGWVYVQALAAVRGSDMPHAGIYLEQAVPNPAAYGSLISYYLETPGDATLTVYDAAGKKVKTLAAGFHAAGRHQESWDGRDARGRKVPGGVYFYSLKAGSVTRTQKLVVAR
jgi:hypothetical protein